MRAGLIDEIEASNGERVNGWLKGGNRKSAPVLTPFACIKMNWEVQGSNRFAGGPKGDPGSSGAAALMV